MARGEKGGKRKERGKGGKTVRVKGVTWRGGRMRGVRKMEKKHRIKGKDLREGKNREGQQDNLEVKELKKGGEELGREEEH